MDSSGHDFFLNLRSSCGGFFLTLASSFSVFFCLFFFFSGCVLAFFLNSWSQHHQPPDSNFLSEVGLKKTAVKALIPKGR